MEIRQLMQWTIGSIHDLLSNSELTKCLTEVYKEEFKVYAKEFGEGLISDNVPKKEWFEHFVDEIAAYNDFDALEMLGKVLIKNRKIKSAAVDVIYSDNLDSTIMTIYQIIPQSTLDLKELAEIYMEEKGIDDFSEVVLDKIEREVK